MTGIVVFAFFQILVSGYACWRGGAPERTVGVLLVAALGATILTPLMPSYTYLDLNLPLLEVDLVLLAALVAVALTADRFWPMWLAALHLMAIGAHGVRVYSPDIVPIAYWSMTARIGYPMLMVLYVGTLRHRRRERSGQPDFGWTHQRLIRLHDGGRSDRNAPDRGPA